MKLFKFRLSTLVHLISQGGFWVHILILEKWLFNDDCIYSRVALWKRLLKIAYLRKVCLFWRTSLSNLSLSYDRLCNTLPFSSEFLELLSLWPTSRPSFLHRELAVYSWFDFSVQQFCLLWSIHKERHCAKLCSNFSSTHHLPFSPLGFKRTFGFLTL